MPEKTYPAKTVYVEYECDEDGCDGTLERTGTTLMSRPPKYPHECTECGTKVNLRKAYPTWDFRRTDEPTYN